MPPRSCFGDSVRSIVLPVQAPYRLDLTATVLRRISSNLVDVAISGGARRTFTVGTRTVLAEIVQRSPTSLELSVDSDVGEAALVALVRRTYGCDRDPAAFARRAAGIDWLAPVAARMRGVRPPRYPDLWEACVNAIVFQQISIEAAGAIMGRFVRAFGVRHERSAFTAHAFPPAERVADVDPAALRDCGLSAAKVAAIRAVACDVRDGTLHEAEIERLDSDRAAARLCELRGIGPWSASVILLRGFGRLDVFPLNDSGVARSVRALTGAEIDVDVVLRMLGDERGMLYYHLLLARLFARGARPSHDAAAVLE